MADRKEMWRKVAQLSQVFFAIEGNISTVCGHEETTLVEKSWVMYIESNIEDVRYLVETYGADPGFIADHVHGKLECIKDGLDYVVSCMGKEKEKDEIIEWLKIISEKTDKIKWLTGHLGPLPPHKNKAAGRTVAAAGASSSDRGKVRTLSNAWQCIDLCIQESPLISPMIASLKRSYDRLPPRLKLCLLCVAVFPENFVVKKRPLIYWWMAEGFISAEDEGERNFMELIRMELTQPCYQEGNIGKVNACRVLPWIGRMLVSIALEAQFLEFYGREKKDEIWGRLCLYDEEDYEAATRETETMLKDVEINFRLHLLQNWFKYLKAKSMKYALRIQRAIQAANKSMDPNKVQQGEQQTIQTTSALDDLCKDCIYLLDNVSCQSRPNLGNLKPFCLWVKNNYFDKLGVWQGSLNTEISSLQDKIQDTCVSIHHALTSLKSCLIDCMHSDEVYDRKKNREGLQKNELLFSHYDLNLRFPSLMKKRPDDGEYYYQEGKLLGIINVNRGYLYMKKEWFRKLKKLRSLHLGRWQDSWPIPHIEVINAGFLKPFFQVAKNLKYVSLRGVSGITELPSTISQCCNLQMLDLKACYSLEKLPPQIVLLTKLTHFDVSQCYLLLQSDKLWRSVLEKLKLLQTLKGVKISGWLRVKIDEKLRKLGIIFTAPMLFTLPIHRFHHLLVLTLTWRTTPSWKDHDLEVEFQLPQNLSKLDLRCYPEKEWPDWLHNHPALQKLYITGGNIQSFPSNLINFKFQKLQILRFKYLTNPKVLYFPESQRHTSFPSLQYHYCTGLNFSTSPVVDEREIHPSPSPPSSPADSDRISM